MTANLVRMILDGWHMSSRLTDASSRQMEDIAQACAAALGDDLPDNAVTNGMIVAWLKKQPNVWNDGKMRQMPQQEFYLGLPE